MTSETDILENICARFNQVQWHDSKLIRFQLFPKDSNRRHDIGFDLRLLTNPRPGSYEWQDAKLEIEDCSIIRLDLDILGIQLCGGDIDGAISERVSAEDLEGTQIQSFDLSRRANPLTYLIKFRMFLVPPGGEIIILGRNFTFKTQETTKDENGQD